MGAILLLTVAGACAPARAQVPAPSPVPAAARAPAQIVTTASGEAKYVPDRAVLQVSVQTRALQAADAGRENAKIQRAVFDTLRALGFGQDQLSTMNYTVQPEYRYDKEGGTPRVTGYVVTNTIRIDVRRVDLLGPAIDASLGRGANLVSGLDFYSSNDDEARRSALSAAVARARGDAEVMARAAGGHLGQLIELTTYEQPRQPRPMMAMAARAGADVATPVSPGEETSRSTVTARWEFVPGGE